MYNSNNDNGMSSSHQEPTRTNPYNHHPMQSHLPSSKPFFRSVVIASPNPTTIVRNQDETMVKEPKTSSFDRDFPTSWAPTSVLRTLPVFHPLEGTHVTVPYTSLDTTLNLLQQAFVQLSCQVIYEAQQLSATCSAMEQHVEFVVSIWQEDREPSSVDIDRKIFVEIQRTDGDSYTFHSHYAKVLLRTVQQQHLSVPEKGSNPTSGAVLDHLARQCPTYPFGDYNDNVDKNVQSALELAAHLLLHSQNRLDALQFGIDSLLQLTNPTCTGLVTARRSADVILRGTNQHAPLTQFLWKALFGTDGNLQEDILRIWVQLWQLQASHPNANGGCANCGGNGSNNTNMDSKNSTMWHEPSLLQAVDLLQHRVTVHVERHPHIATLALQGLTALTALAPPHCQVTTRIAWPSVQRAHAVGTATHAALAKASGQLLAVTN